MPIYEYRCQDCGHEFEILQRMADDPLTECPKCGQEALTKLVSAAGFQLKGSGWYETDFKHSGKKPDKQKAGEGSGEKRTPKEGGGTSESSGEQTSGGSGAAAADA